VRDKPTPDALAVLLRDIAAGRLPPADGRVTVLPGPAARDAGVLGFTAHAVIFIDADPAWVTSQLPPGDLAAPLSPDFLKVRAWRADGGLVVLGQGIASRWPPRLAT
jgi:hypothetical protein